MYWLRVWVCFLLLVVLGFVEISNSHVLSRDPEHDEEEHLNLLLNELDRRNTDLKHAEEAERELDEEFSKRINRQNENEEDWNSGHAFTERNRNENNKRRKESERRQEERRINELSEKRYHDNRGIGRVTKFGDIKRERGNEEKEEREIKRGRGDEEKRGSEEEELPGDNLHLAVLQDTRKRQNSGIVVPQDVVFPDGSIVETNEGPLQTLAAAMRGDIPDYIDLHFKSPPTVLPPRQRKKRQFGYRDSIKWQNGIVPFRVELSTFSDQAKARTVIDESVASLHRETCIEMREITQAETSNYQDYLVVLGNETGCWSWLGNAKFGTKYQQPQKLSLGNGCVGVKTALHEFLHALGMEHEQSRQDRDNYLRVLYQNINEDNQYNFDREATRDDNPYDIGSILQYSPYGFAKSGTSGMLSKDPHLEFLMYLGLDLTFYDIMDITRGYGCTANCDQASLPDCKNGGFINHLCQCKCPEGLTSDSNCTQVTTQACGGIINLQNGQSQSITSPNHPQPYTSGTECIWLIEGESDSRIEITIDEMDLPFDASTYTCQHFLEIQYNLIAQQGPRECGAVFSPSPVSYMTSLSNPAKNVMMIKFDSATNSEITAKNGFKATVRAFQSGCTSNPCKMGSTCVEGPTEGDYTCHCYPGMGGQFCDMVDDKSHVSCSFESDTVSGCFLTNDPTADMLWGTTTRQKKADGLYQYAKDGYVYANFELYKEVHYYYDRARYISAVTFEATSRCLVFSYFFEMKSVTYPSILRVAYKDSSGSETVLLYANSTTGSSWLEKQYDIPSVDGLQLVFEGLYGQNKVGLDAVNLFAGACDHPCSQGNPCTNGGSCLPGSGNTFTCQCQEKFQGTYCETLKPTAEFTCDFELDIGSLNYDCFLKNTNNDDFDWQSRSDETPSANTGPIRSYDGVKYMYTEASSPRVTGDTARLVTDLVFQDSWYCLKFKYNMRGSDGMGTMRAGTTDGNGNDVIAWFKQGDQGSLWHSAVINLKMGPGRQIFIDGIRGTGWKSDMAIDAASLASGTCGEFECNFESDPNCGLLDCTDCDDNFNWSRHTGSTLSVNTGPSSAYSGTHYLYAEMSGRSGTDNTRLVTKYPFADTPYCMEFAYHMYGGGVGSLNLHLNDTETGTMTTIWSVTGDQGNQWFDGLVTLGSVNFKTQLVIEAVRANSWAGDIAIDDVTMSTTCPAFECTFELSDFGCVLFDSTDDNFDWTTGSGSTPSAGTGPEQAASGSGYKYIETSTPRQSGEKATLESSYLTIRPGGQSCFSFSYILNGSDVGSLVVEMMELDGTVKQIFTESREVTTWKQANVNLQSDQAFKIYIKATVGDGELGDIAIDNVKLDTVACAPVLSCTFEPSDPLCLLDNVPASNDEDQFDWTKYTGSTPSSNTGPTTAFNGDYYTYTETSYPRQPADVAILRSETLQTFGDFCLSFHYHMYGASMGSLEILVKEANQAVVSVWSKSGDQGNQWTEAKVDFTTNSAFTLSFVGTRASSWQGDVAVDDVLLSVSKCM